MKITTILCTYNRHQSLTAALESIARQRLPETTEWEVIVVDNNSTDQTREVAEEFCCTYPGRFRYVFEPHPGKSYALNTGIREAKGDVLAFMDDDVTLEADWLQNLTAALGGDEWVGSGGRVLPERMPSMPRWIPVQDRYGLAPLALFDLGTEGAPLTESPFGTNMAFKREMFTKYGGFRTDLGPQPGSEIRGEDTEFGLRLLRAGERLRYEPSAIVYHAVPKNRLQKRYFLSWWFDKARSEVRVAGSELKAQPAVGGIPLTMLRRLAVWTVRWTFALEPAYRFSCKLKVWGKLGEIAEFHRRSRAGRWQVG
jgi:glycosyltransferase involved in cell wall biosynthesis